MIGKLITFEGIDGSGKTTISKLVYKHLLKQNIKTILLKEPTKTKLGRFIIKSIDSDISQFSLSLLFMADHANLVQKIKKLIAKNIVVLCDRYNDSSYAYQSIELEKALSEYDIDAMSWLINFQKPFTITPDLTLVFIISPTNALDRINKKKKTRFENIDFLKKVQNNYLLLAKKYNRIKLIDANKNINDVTEECIKEIMKLCIYPSPPQPSKQN